MTNSERDSVTSNERLMALLRRAQAYIYSGPPRNPDHDSESVLSAEIRAALESNAHETPAALPASDRNTIIDAMSYCSDYLSRWKGAGNSVNAQHTIDRLQGMLERIAQKANQSHDWKRDDEGDFR